MKTFINSHMDRVNEILYSSHQQFQEHPKYGLVHVVCNEWLHVHSQESWIGGTLLLRRFDNPKIMINYGIE